MKFIVPSLSTVALVVLAAACPLHAALSGTSNSPSAAASPAEDVAVHRSPRTGEALFLKNQAASPNSALRAKSASSPKHPSAIVRSTRLHPNAQNKPDHVLAADAFLGRHGHHFGLADVPREMLAQQTDVDALGMAHVRYQQQHRGVPVYGADLRVHLSADGVVNTASGRVVPRLQVDPWPTLTAESAVALANTYWQSTWPGAPQPSPLSTDLCVLVPELVGLKSPAPVSPNSPTTAWLVWRVLLAANTPLDGEFFVDAHDATLRHYATGTREAINREVTDYSTGWNYLDEPVDVGGQIYILGRSEGQPPRGPCPFPQYTNSLDTDNLYDLLGQAHNYFLATFGRNGINGLGGTFNPRFGAYLSTTTQGITFVDNFDIFTRSMTCPSAAFWWSGTIMVCYDVVESDLVGHEYGHGLPFYSHWDQNGYPVGMVYSGESGALDESQANYWGEMLEKQVTGSSDWLFGSTNTLLGVRLNYTNPPSSTRGGYGQPDLVYPDRFCHTNVECTSVDKYGVHINGALVTKAMTLMAIGGAFNGCQIRAIGPEALEQILYRAVSLYYATAETFNGAYLDLIQAATDLYPPSVVREVTAALQSVEMDQPGACSSVPARPPACACTASNQPPSIYYHPQGQVVGEGSSTAFAVGVSAAAPLSLQWQFNGTVIPTATNADLALTNVTATNSGDYCVVVTNTYGSVTSQVATLTVVLPGSMRFAVDAEGLSVTNGVLRLRLLGDAGAKVILEASSDLTSWLPLQTNTIPVGGLDWLHSIGTNQGSFFRARLRQ